MWQGYRSWYAVRIYVLSASRCFELLALTIGTQDTCQERNRSEQKGLACAETVQAELKGETCL
jgi:hypothetical protein